MTYRLPCAGLALLGALLVTPSTQAGPHPFYYKEGSVVKAASMPLRMSLDKAHACGSRTRLWPYVQSLLRQKVTRFCRRYRNTQILVPKFVIEATKNAIVGGQVRCQFRIRITKAGGCARSFLSGWDRIRASAFGKASGKANTIAYCRRYRIMSAMRRMSVRRARPKIAAFCRKKGYRVLESVRIVRYIGLRNLSRMSSRYICSADFRISFQCRK